MRLLIDTHILVWIVLNDRRLSEAQRAVLENPENVIVVSPVVAYELTQLQVTKRIPLRESIERLEELVGFETTDLPFECWRMRARLPDIHRDPIDRLLVAQALIGDMSLVTADAKIRRYPVPCI